MKTLQQIIAETVDKPRSEDEQNFIDKHIVDKKGHPVAGEDQFTKKAKKAKRLADYEEGEDKAVNENRISGFVDFLLKTQSIDESFDLIEAVKAGKMKLKDGSSVVLSKEEASAVSELFDNLNSSNKKKMEEKMMENKKSFEEIVKFAKETM